MKKINYEKSMERLEEIVTKLEEGSLPLEESIKLYEEGTKLTAGCYEILKNAEQKITDINSLSEKEDE